MGDIVKKILALFITLCVSPAAAQWQVPQGAVPVGKGPGFSNFASILPGANNNCLLVSGGVWTSAPCPGGTPSGVTSLGSLTGAVACGAGVVCAAGTLSADLGTSGTKIGLLNASKTDSGNNTFTGAMTIGPGSASATRYLITLDGGTASGAGVAFDFRKGGVDFWGVGVASAVTGSGTSNDFNFYNYATGTSFTLNSSGQSLWPASGYMNYGTTGGTAGYGFRDNAGTMQYKNSGGSWAAFSSGSGSGGACVIPTGLDPSGVTDSAPGIQSAMNAIASTGYGCIQLPPGIFKLNSNVNVATDIPFALRGAGIGATIINVNNTTGGIFWSGTMSAAVKSVVTLSDFDIVAANGANAGDAISIYRAAASTNPNYGNVTTILKNIRCRSTTNDSTTEKFNNCMHVYNANGVIVDSVSSYQIHSNASFFRLDNGIFPSYGGATNVWFSNIISQGGDYGIYATGWMEAVYILGSYSIVGANYGLYYDGTGTGPGGACATNFHIHGGDMNNRSNNIYLKCINGVIINGGDYYKGVGTADVDVHSVDLSNVSKVSVVGNQFQTAVASLTGKSASLNCDNCTALSFTGNTVLSSSSGWSGFSVTNSNHVYASGNSLYTVSGGSAQGIYFIGNNYAKMDNLIQGWATCQNTTTSTNLTNNNTCY